MRSANELDFYQGPSKQWRWRLTSGINGKIIAASSEAFKNLLDCVKNYKLIAGSPVWSVRYADGVSPKKRLDVGALLK